MRLGGDGSRICTPKLRFTYKHQRKFVQVWDGKWGFCKDRQSGSGGQECRLVAVVMGVTGCAGGSFGDLGTCV